MTQKRSLKIPNVRGVFFLAHSSSKFFNISHLLLSGSSTASAATGITWLHLQNRTEQILRGGRQELNLSVRMETVQVRTLWWKALVNVCVVTLVVGVWRNGETRGQVQFSIKLK